MATRNSVNAFSSLAVALGLGGPAASADQLTIVGAGPGAGAYQLAGAMAEAVNRVKEADVIVTNRASKGFVANTRMVETGGADLALTNGTFVYSAQNSLPPFTEMTAENIQGVGPVTTSWFHMTFAADSGIGSYMDLAGKRVNFAAKGSSTEFITRMIFEKLGILDQISPEYMRWDQAATALTDGNVAAFSIPNPVPSPSVLQASASRPIHVLSLPNEVIEHFIEYNPDYYRDTVPAGSYAGMEDKEFETIAYSIFVAANANVRRRCLQGHQDGP